MMIYRAAGNPVLLRVIKGLWDLSERYRRAYLQQPARAGESTAEHRRLLELLRSRDGDAAAVYVREHNEKTIRVLADSYVPGHDG
jgi:DNA-binding FadR family transcriptional regulator